MVAMDMEIMVTRIDSGELRYTAGRFPDEIKISGYLARNAEKPYLYQKDGRVIIDLANGYAEYTLGSYDDVADLYEAHRTYLKVKD